MKSNAEATLREADAVIIQIGKLSARSNVIPDKELHKMVSELKMMACKIQAHLDTRLESFCDPEIAADGR